MTPEDKRFIECCGDDRFEVIKRAREHIIDATNIESKPEEMQVLDNLLFRCWQMGWLKNDYHQLEKENAKLKEVCDFNCPVHKLATHNACLTCIAIRNSPHHNLKNVTDEELQKIIKDAESEMEM